MRKIVVILALMTAILALSACGEEELPPIEHVLVVTATPEPGTILLVITVTPGPNGTPDETQDAGEPDANPTPALSPTPDLSPTPPPTSTLLVIPTPGEAESTAGPLVTPTGLPALFPTTVVADVPVAEQVFERGRMFWIRHNRQIWVMISSEDDSNRGDWFCYLDTFVEGEPELDPNLIPPDGLYQPRRGFGKLWRTRTELREALGWATTPEFELTSTYRYIAGGEVSNGEYFPGPGEHRLTTLYNDVISFFEGEVRGDCQGGTWRMTPAE
jgi:hypothetical protein